MFLEYTLDLVSFLLKTVVVIVAILIPVILIISGIEKATNGKNKKGTGRFEYEDLKEVQKSTKKLISKALNDSNPDLYLKKKLLKNKVITRDEGYFKGKELKDITDDNSDPAETINPVKAKEQNNDSNKDLKSTALESKGQEIKAQEAKVQEAKAPDTAAQESQAQAATAQSQAETQPEDQILTSFTAFEGMLADKLNNLSGKAKSESDPQVKYLKAYRDRVHELVEARKDLLNGEFRPRNVFVFDFRGSSSGKEFKTLRKAIDLIIAKADERDEVIINLTSPGGLVNTYGLCASQLQRIRDRNIRLTVTVDEVAASGGYLMACVANHIVAAPFAYVGSIGVIAGIPNFRKVLNKYDVDYEQVTAGKYKRTLSVFGENTEEGRKKFQEELEAVHARFKEQVLRYRPQLDAEKVMTGEHWLAIDAKKLGLVDEISTSDEYINSRVELAYKSAIKLKWVKEEKKNVLNKLLAKGVLGLLHGKNASLSKNLKSEIDKIDDNNFLNIK